MNSMKCAIALITVFLVLASLSAVCADETLYLTTQGQDVAMSGGQWSTNFQLTNGVPAGKQATLVIDARVDGAYDSAAPAACLTVTVNGHALSGPVRASGTASDLVNKEDEFFTTNGWDWTWYASSKWRLLYAPNYSLPMPLGQYQVADSSQAPYHFVWDITPYISANPRVSTPVVLSSSLAVHFKDVRIEVANPLPGIHPTAPPTGTVPTYVPNSPGTLDMGVRLYPGGDITFDASGSTFTVRTQTSQPSSAWFTSASTGTPSSIGTGGYATTSWTCTGYRVDRRVDVLSDHVHVADTFTNTGSALVGVISQVRLLLPTLQNQQLSIRLGGYPACGGNWQQSPASTNPTSVASWTNTNGPTLAIGLAAENDIFRAHNTSICESSPLAVGLWDPHLGIDVGANHTLEWEIYPVPGGDYWAVINAIRRNWGSNYTIPGPITCQFGAEDGTQDASYYANWMNQRGVKWVISGQGIAKNTTEWNAMGGQTLNPGALAESTALPLATTWCQGVSNWSTKVHSTVPGGKVLAYLHTQISTINGTYTNPPTVYANSQLFDYQGNRVYTPGTSQNPLYMFLTTQNNSFGTAMNSTISTLLGTYAFDGFFHDEISYASPGILSYYGNANWEWDGCSVMIDQGTHALQNTTQTPGGKVSYATLVQQPWKLSAFQSIINQERPIVGNLCYVWTKSLNALHLPLVRETVGGYCAVLDSHLVSPLGLGNHANGNYNDDTNRSYLVRRLLDYGALTVPYWWIDAPLSQPHYISLMFPITPVELHPGVIIGTDRIITNRSGQFGWQDGSPADVYVFNGSGQYVSNLSGYANASVSTIKNGNGWLTEVRLASDHFAVLLKKVIHKITPTSYTDIPASPPYPDTNQTELINGTIPGTNFNDSGWVGWNGYGSVPWAGGNFDLGQIFDLYDTTVYGLNNPTSYIRPLGSIRASFSTDGSTYSNQQDFTTTSDERAGDPAVSAYARTFSSGTRGRYAKVLCNQWNGDVNYHWLFLGEVEFRTPALKYKSYTYGVNPQTAYRDEGGNSLCDSVIPGTSYLDQGWVGWSGYSAWPWLYMVFDFGQTVRVNRINISSLNAPSWGIKPLYTLYVDFSNDGVNFGTTQVFTTTTQEQAGDPAVAAITRSLTSSTGRYARVQFNQLDSSSSYPWIFLGEVSFDGSMTP